MDCRRRLGRMIRTCVALLSVIGVSGCAMHHFQAVGLPITVDQRCDTCNLSVAQGCRCVADPEYHSTVWFPMKPECLGKIDPAEEARIRLPDTNRQIDPGPQSTPLETDQAKDARTRDDEGRVSEAGDQPQAILVIPEPSWRDSSPLTDGQLEETGTSAAR